MRITNILSRLAIDRTSFGGAKISAKIVAGMIKNHITLKKNSDTPLENLKWRQKLRWMAQGLP